MVIIKSFDPKITWPGKIPKSILDSIQVYVKNYVKMNKCIHRGFQTTRRQGSHPINRFHEFISPTTRSVHF